MHCYIIKKKLISFFLYNKKMNFINYLSYLSIISMFEGYVNKIISILIYNAILYKYYLLTIIIS